jgi:Di-sulfide bridge nucleocytoplasmic transport domain
LTSYICTGAQGPNSNTSSLLFSSSPNASPFQFGGKDGTIPSSSNPTSVFSFEPRTPWAPPPNFSPHKAFPISPAPDIADVSMSTAGSPTPEASPSARTRRTSGNEVALSSPVSPLRRSAYKARERDRSRERERERGRRRGLIPSRRDESDTSDDENVCRCQLGTYSETFLGTSNVYIAGKPTSARRRRSVSPAFPNATSFSWRTSLCVIRVSWATTIAASRRSDITHPAIFNSSSISLYSLCFYTSRSWRYVPFNETWMKKWQSIPLVRLDSSRRPHDTDDILPVAGTLREISQCTKLYLANKCDPAHRIPHMESTCLEWEECMNRDPSVVGRARVAAETFAQVVNSFVEEISWKTLVREGLISSPCTLSCLSFGAHVRCIIRAGIYPCVIGLLCRIYEYDALALSIQARTPCPTTATTSPFDAHRNPCTFHTMGGWKLGGVGWSAISVARFTSKKERWLFALRTVRSLCPLVS